MWEMEGGGRGLRHDEVMVGRCTALNMASSMYIVHANKQRKLNIFQIRKQSTLNIDLNIAGRNGYGKSQE